VIKIETESDIERLRQVALLQQAELHRLSKRLVELTTALAEARGEDAILALQQELAFLKEELAARNQEIFGASSEKHSRDKETNRGTGSEAVSSLRSAPRA
jgi:predicted  nucleic acid-binding Zn-ribbon protein